MRKFSLIAAIIVFAFSGATRAQDFTVSELMQLRTSSLSNFETVVMEKGYTLNDVDKEYDHYATFKKGHSTISWGYVKNEHFQQIDTVIIYLTPKEEEYNKLKESVKDRKSRNHFYKNETHILHVNMDNDVVVHFFTKYNERPLYEIEVSPLDGDRYDHQ